MGKKDVGPAEVVAKDLDVAKKINIFEKNSSKRAKSPNIGHPCGQKRQNF